MSIVEKPAGNFLRDPKAVLDAALYKRLSEPPITLEGGAQVPAGSFFKADNCFPYIAIGEAESSGGAEWTTKTEGGVQLTYTVDVWSQVASTKEVNLIAAEVIKRLTQEKLDLSPEGFNIAIQRLEQDLTQKLPDGQTIRRYLKFKVFIADLVTPQPH